MMAFRAFEPHTEEYLSDKRGSIRGVALVAPHGNGAVLVRAALRREQLAHKLIPRRVGAELLADPVVEQQHRLHAHAGGIRTDEIAPLDRPVVGPCGVVEQMLDPLVALLRVPAVEKRARLPDGR